MGISRTINRPFFSGSLSTMNYKSLNYQPRTVVNPFRGFVLWVGGHWPCVKLSHGREKLNARGKNSGDLTCVWLWLSSERALSAFGLKKRFLRESIFWLKISKMLEMLSMDSRVTVRKKDSERCIAEAEPSWSEDEVLRIYRVWQSRGLQTFYITTNRNLVEVWS